MVERVAGDQGEVLGGRVLEHPDGLGRHNPGPYDLVGQLHATSGRDRHGVAVAHLAERTEQRVAVAGERGVAAEAWKSGLGEVADGDIELTIADAGYDRRTEPDPRDRDGTDWIARCKTGDRCGRGSPF